RLGLVLQRGELRRERALLRLQRRDLAAVAIEPLLELGRLLLERLPDLLHPLQALLGLGQLALAGREVLPGARQLALALDQLLAQVAELALASRPAALGPRAARPLELGLELRDLPLELADLAQRAAVEHPGLVLLGLLRHLVEPEVDDRRLRRQRRIDHRRGLDELALDLLAPPLLDRRERQGRRPRRRLWRPGRRGRRRRLWRAGPAPWPWRGLRRLRRRGPGAWPRRGLRRLRRRGPGAWPRRGLQCLRRRGPGAWPRRGLHGRRRLAVGAAHRVRHRLGDRAALGRRGLLGRTLERRRRRHPDAVERDHVRRPERDLLRLEP